MPVADDGLELARMLLAGNYDGVVALFDPVLSERLPATTLQTNWEGVRRSRLGPGEVQIGQPTVAVHVPLEGAGPVRIDSYYDADGRISGLWFRWT